MKTLEHIYAIKNLISRGPSSDDLSFSNSLILHFMDVARSRLIEQKADKYHFISEQSYQDFCVTLAHSSFNNCCVDVPDCFLSKSTVELPKFLNSRWGNFIKVMDMNGEVIPEQNMTEHRLSKYARTKPTATYFIHDNHVYIQGNIYIQNIIVNGLFADTVAAAAVNCNPVESGDACEPYDKEYPIDSDLVDPMYKMVLEYLLKYPLTNDATSDAKDTPKQASNS